MLNFRKWEWNGQKLAHPARILQRVVFLTFATPFILVGVGFLYLGGFWDAADSILNELVP